MRRWGVGPVGIVVLAALVALAQGAAAPAGHGNGNGKGKAKGQRPRVDTSVSARANVAGWYAEPVSASIWAARPHGVIDTCVMSDAVQHPDGTQTSSRTLLPNAEPSDCRIDVDVASSRVETIVVEVRHWRWTAERRLVLRVDVDDPAVSISRSDVADDGDVSLAGSVSDAFSGPVLVRLAFEETSGRADPFVADADCRGCGVAEPCSAARAPRCGRSATWSYSGELGPGTWRVTPIAFDVAGNEARGTASTVIVPFSAPPPTIGVNPPDGRIGIPLPGPLSVRLERIIG